MGPAEVVRVLLEEEATRRDAATICNRRRRAGFPTGKPFESWRETSSSTPSATQQALKTPEGIPSGGEPRRRRTMRHRQVPPARSLGQRRGRRRAHRRLVHHRDARPLVTRHRADDTVAKAVNRILSADLVVIDDIGLIPVPAEAAEALFRVIDPAYERRSVAISSNIHPGGFDQLLPATMATAAVDRLMYYAHVVVTDGDSYRFAQTRDGKGVTPLA